MSIEIKRSDKYVDYNISAANNRGYITIDTSDWINKPWMFYELPSLKFEIYTETNGELVKHQNFSREIRTYNPVYSPLGVLNVTIDIRNVPEEFILRITPIFDNDAIAARNMLIENGIENGDIWGSDQDVPTQLFNLNLEFIECEGEYIPPTPPVPPTHQETITGIPPITFDGSTGEPLVSWTILGNGSQTGTPTPDNPVMPEFVGDKTANLLPYESKSVDVRGVTVTVYPNKIKVSGTATSSGGRTTKVIGLFRLKAGTYTSAKYGGAGLVYYIQNSNNSILGSTFTLETDTDVYLGLNVNEGVTYDEECQIMLNEGSTSLPFEPFGYKIPITCAGQTVPVYLGEVPTVRRVKKLVLDGTEDWALVGVDYIHGLYIDDAPIGNYEAQICSHFIHASSWSELQNTNNSFGISLLNRIVIHDESIRTSEDFKAYLASEYAAGHPVTIWYVLVNEQTGIVNEPLCKISTYADELSSEDAAVTIPTAKGQNALTVDTPIQPSEMTITYIKEGQ